MPAIFLNVISLNTGSHAIFSLYSFIHFDSSFAILIYNTFTYYSVKYSRFLLQAGRSIQAIRKSVLPLNNVHAEYNEVYVKTVLALFYENSCASVTTVISSLFKFRPTLTVENLALRQQLATVQHLGGTPSLIWFDRKFWAYCH